MKITNQQSKIEVSIDNKRRYAHVVFLLDRDDFLKDISNLRKKWKLEKLLSKNDYPYWDFFPNFDYIEQNKISLPRFKNEEHKDLYQKYKTLVDGDKLEKLMWNLTDLENRGVVARDELTLLYKYEVITSFFELFRFQIRELRKKYKYPPNFDRIIGSAVLYGLVEDEDYSLYEIKINEPDIEDLPYFEEPKLQMSFYPLAEPEEILEAIKQQKTKLIDEYEKKYVGGQQIDYDTAENVERDRKWYWRRKLEGLSWSKLHNDIKARKEAQISVEGIRIAVNRYKEKLN
jgi:hypothetical protein